MRDLQTLLIPRPVYVRDTQSANVKQAVSLWSGKPLRVFVIEQAGSEYADIGDSMSLGICAHASDRYFLTVVKVDIPLCGSGAESHLSG